MVASFAVGTLVTGTVAYAAEKPNGQPFEALWDAITDLQTQIDMGKGIDKNNDLITKKGEIVLGPGEFNTLEVRCNSDEVFLTNSAIVNTFPQKPEVQFSGGVVSIIDHYGNLGGFQIEVGKRMGILSEETTKDITLEISIVCAKP